MHAHELYDYPADSYWTVSQVAKFLNVSTSWVYRRSEIDLPVARFGGLLRFRPEDVRAWANQHLVAPAAQRAKYMTGQRQASSGQR